MENINLLTGQKKTQKKRSALFNISLLILLITVLGTSVILLYMFYLRLSISKVSDSQSQAINEMRSFESKRAKQLALKERLANIEKIIPQNSSLGSKISSVLQDVPGALTIEGLSAQEGSISIKISSRNLLDINQFFDRAKEAPSEKGSAVKKVEIENFAFTESNGSYNASVKFTF